MAAPLRMSFLPKTHYFLRFSGQSRDLISHKPVWQYCIRGASQNTSKFTGLFHKFESKPLLKLTKRLILSTAGVATVCGVGYLARAHGKDVAVVLAADSAVVKPNHRISRQIKSSTDDSGLKLTLYQYQTCPFCCKVRAFLDYHGLSYNVVEVNSVTRKQLKWTTYPKVPVLVVDGVGENGFMQLNDSSVIMSVLKTYLHHKSQRSQRSLEEISKCYPVLESKEKKKTVLEYPNKYFIMYFDEKSVLKKETKETYKEERKWRSWTDDTFVHVLSPNIYRSPFEAYQAFNYFSEVGNWKEEFTTMERALVVYVGSVAMYLVGKMLKRKYKLEDDVRLSLYKESRHWMKAKGSHRPFMGGDEPNLADLSVYGSLVAIEGCEAFTDLLNNTDIGSWFADMKALVTSRAGRTLQDANK